MVLFHYARKTFKRIRKSETLKQMAGLVLDFFFTSVYPGTSNALLHSSGPELLQPPQYGGKAWNHELSLAQVTRAQGEVESTLCLSATQTGTEPEGKERRLLGRELQ